MTSPSGLNFWDHLDELRHVLLRMVGAVCVLTLVAFCFKEPLFRMVLVPNSPHFPLYRLLGGDDSAISLVNTRLASQFLIHMKVSCYTGVMMASPYIIYQLFAFISPALYANERRPVITATLWGYLLFLIGVMLSYFIIFPLTFRFLSAYQVSDSVVNTITLTSYVDTMLSLTLMMGIVFEMPLLCWLLSRLGVLSSTFMKSYRRHAIIVILLMAAIITPTTDVFTLLVVTFPMYILYEASILIVQHGEPKRRTNVDNE